MKTLYPKPYTLNPKNGYILVESVVAMTIVVVGLLGIFSLLSQSLSLNRVVGDRYVGTYLAAEGIEVAKNIIDNNIVNSRPWNAGFSNGSFEVDFDSLSLESNLNRYIKLDSPNGRYGYRDGADTRFKRTIKIELLGSGEEIKVNSVVKWLSRGEADFKVDLEDHFFNWR
ncbi:MAG: hypothetical protein ABH822_00875 [Patescibacteria group bacterium]